MKKIIPALLLLFAVAFANAQNFTQVSEGFEAAVSTIEKETTNDRIAFVRGDAVFTAPRVFNKQTIRRLNATTMAEEWRLEMDMKWDYKNITLNYDTVALLDNGNLAIICVHYNQKLGKADVYARMIDEDGEELETHKLTSLIAPKENDILIKAFYANKHFVIYAISNLLNDESRILQVAWVNENFEEVRKQNTQLGGPQALENASYDAKRNCLYVTTKHQVSGKLTGVNVKSNFLAKFDMNKLAPVVKDIDFEDYTGFFNAVDVDTATGQPYLFGMAGPKRSSNMNSTFAIKLDPETLDFLEQNFFPIYKEVVDKVSASKSAYDKIGESSSAVALSFNKAVFSNKKIYVVFENSNVGLHTGQYVVEYGKTFKDVSQYYLPNYGYGKSLPTLNQAGALQLFFTADIKKFNKANPEAIQLPASGGYGDVGLYDATVANGKIAYRNYYVFKNTAKALNSVVSVVQKANGKASCFVTVGDMMLYKTSFIRATEL